VEADPSQEPGLRSRFEQELADGRLTITFRAASRTRGESVSFFQHLDEQGHSSLVHDGSLNLAPVARHVVTTTDWSELVGFHGVPYFAKIDIEGGEPAFLQGIVGSGCYPTYMSCEIQTFEPIAIMHEIGYRRFRLINQAKVNEFPIPDPPLEGKLVLDPPRHHWSGLFGRELPGDRWFSYAEIQDIHGKLHELWSHGTLTIGWLDCHAWMPAELVVPQRA
jgi:hypothetical protein